MVAHQRPADTARITRCDGDCPHAEATLLWPEALEVFGDGAEQLAFLRSHGVREPRLRPHAGDVTSAPRSLRS
jgi:hypothetical protein